MKYFIVTCIYLTGLSAFAQQITGRIKDAYSGNPIQGATVCILNSTSCTSTGKQGQFNITPLTPGDSLRISCTGYATACVPAENDLTIFLQEKPGVLNEVIVSASREEQTRNTVPNAISKVNQSTIKDSRATGIYQLLNKASGVQMVNLGNEQHTMAIRQPVSYNALYLYLEDGLPIRPTGLFNHNALYEINMNALKDIEVIKGPASSLYGSNAIGAAINFLSLNPSAGAGSQIAFQGDKYHYYRAEGTVNAGTAKAGIVASSYFAHQQDSWQDYTDFDKLSGSLKARYELSTSTRLSLSANYNYLYTQTPGSLDSARFYSRSYGSNQRFTYRRVKAFRTSARLDHSWNAANSTFLTAFFRDNTTDQLPSYSISDVRNSARQYVLSYGQQNQQRFNSLGILLQHRLNLRPWNSRLIAGMYLDASPTSFYARYLQISKDIVSNYYTGYTDTDSLIDKYRISILNTAAYIQYECEPLNRLHIVGGLRQDRLLYSFRNNLPQERTKYKNAEKNLFQVFAPKIGATYNYAKAAGLYSNFSVGYQPPETSMLYSSQQLSRLKQASFYNYELGGWIGILQGKLNIDYSLYRMEGRNEIISVLMDDNTTQNQNAASTRHTGIEVNVGYRPLPSLSFRLSGTAARHQYVNYSEVNQGKTKIYNRKTMSNAPTFVGNCEISWKPSNLKGFRSMLEWQSVSKYFINPANTKSYGGYSIFNFRSGYDFVQGAAKGLGIWFNVLNLTNELYAATVTANQYRTTYNAAPPASFTLGIAYSFERKRN